MGDELKPSTGTNMTHIEPVCWTSEEQIQKAQADPGHNMLIWGEPLVYHPDVALVRMSDAQAALTAPREENDRLRKELLEMIGKAERQWAGWVKEEVRAKAAEARATTAETEAATLRALLAEAMDGSRPLPYDRETLGRFVREAWVRWAGTQPNPKPSWLVSFDELEEPDKEADRQIGEALARWTLIGDSAARAVSAKIKEKSGG